MNRREVIKSSVFGVLGVSLSQISWATNTRIPVEEDKLHKTYPAIHPDIVSEVVGVSHFNLERLKELVDNRPELARANWDWGFGDWESAIGAASHVGRPDIVEYLITRGASPTIFTLAMLGKFDHVKAIVDEHPKVKDLCGPHGINLLTHAEIGSFNKESKTECKKLYDYLKSLGCEDSTSKYEKLAEEDKTKYLGDYKYGEGENDGFSVKLNMRKLLSLGKIGSFGGALYCNGDSIFDYNGAPSVKISFNDDNGVIKSLTVKEPDFEITAIKQ